MPRISSTRKTVDYTFNSIDGAKVTLWDTLSIGELERIQDESLTKMGRVILMCTLLIHSWNLTDDEDKVLPVEEQYVRQLPFDDLQAMLETTSVYRNMLKKAEDLEDETMEKKML